MATAYVTAAEISSILGERYTTLLDRDGDGSADAGLIDTIIDDAGALVDARLTQRLSTPFAAITDTPATPDIVRLITRHVVLWMMYKWVDADGDDATSHWDTADGFLTGILKGDLDVPGHARQTGAKAQYNAVWDGDDPFFSGQTSSGIDRSRGL